MMGGAGERRVGVRFLGASLSRGEVVGALRASALDVVEGDVAPRVLVIDDADDVALSTTYELSGAGRDRLFVITARPASAKVWRLLEAGAGDVAAWTLGPERVAAAVAARLERWSTIDELVAAPVVREHLVGQSRAWTSILRRVVEAARFSNSPVLINGESGTGKELVARLIHTLDGRPQRGELVVLDCTTVVPELSGSEFFGHERGAFTGAAGAREGAFALADQGTLFLDEVGELPPVLQAQLLRVVQERYYKRVGGNEWHRSEFRLVCATNRDLRAEVEAGRFRSDLYHRIAGAVLTLPPLRDRTDDIVPLVMHFLSELRPGPVLELDEVVRSYFIGRPYPGNVRDLRQLVQRVADRHVGLGPVTAGDLPCEEWPRGLAEADWRGDELRSCVTRALAMGVRMKEMGRATEELAVTLAVHDSDGNLQRAAQRLGVTDRALQMRRAGRRAD